MIFHCIYSTTEVVPCYKTRVLTSFSATSSARFSIQGGNVLPEARTLQNESGVRVFHQFFGFMRGVNPPPHHRIEFFRSLVISS